MCVCVRGDEEAPLGFLVALAFSLFLSLSPFLFLGALQGLGLLINLVEYSARNRHSLVDMDFTAPSYPEDSLPQAQEEREQPQASQAQASQAQASQPVAAPSEPTAPGPEEQVKPPGSGALAALVQVCGCSV